MDLFFFFFFFKQKTAYEMRISDWSSDVCSSDLRSAPAGASERARRRPVRRLPRRSMRPRSQSCARPAHRPLRGRENRPPVRQGRAGSDGYGPRFRSRRDAALRMTGPTARKDRRRRHFGAFAGNSRKEEPEERFQRAPIRRLAELTDVEDIHVVIVLMLARHDPDKGIGAGSRAHVDRPGRRSEEHTSELQSLMRISYAVFCLKKKNNSILPTQHSR